MEWLSFQAPTTLFDEGTDTFSITDGRSSLLPGFLLATEELPVDANGDFVEPPPDPVTGQSRLFSGQVRVAGIVDGRSLAVPEPAPAWLLIAAFRGPERVPAADGGALLCAMRARRRRRRTVHAAGRAGRARAPDRLQRVPALEPPIGPLMTRRCSV